MARRCCRLRKVLMCVCTPCLSLALMLSYVSIKFSTLMSGGAQLGTSAVLNEVHFMATGTSRNGTFGPVPLYFWGEPSRTDALWNRLQLAVDHHFNPILNPLTALNASARSSFGDSLLNQSFSEVTSSTRGRNIFEQLPKHLQEYATYMRRRSYPTLIQPDGVCGAKAEDEVEPLLVLFAIKTSESNFKRRQAIRQTWGQVGWVAGQKSNGSGTGGGGGGGHVGRVFLIGKGNTGDVSGDVSDQLRAESQHHGDILQWDFKDTFFNLTLKDVLFWEWFSRHCHARFVFKGDDDVFVNTPRLIGYLRDTLKRPDARVAMRDFMVGDVIRGATPAHVETSKYFVPLSFYKGLYPTYAGGGGVVYSGLLARSLHNISKTVHLFPIDDVYVGMCMSRLNASPVHHPAFLTFGFPRKEEEEPCSYHTILLVHKRTPEQLVGLWAHVNNSRSQCGHVPLRKDKSKKT